MDTTLFLNVFFAVTTFIGIGLTIYYGREAAVLRNQLRTIGWDDIKTAASDLATVIARDFRPTVLFSPDIRGGILGYFLSEELPYAVPLVVGICEWTPGGRDLKAPTHS